jgi:uncharacterized membrane protein
VPDETPQTGLSDNTAGALAYVTIIPAIIFLVVAPYNANRNIRFHAWQSIFLSIVWFALCVIAIIPILGWIIFFVGILTLVVIWVICVLKASKGERFMVPVLGNLAEKQAGA